MKNFIEFPMLPITEKTFERQGWEKNIESELDKEGESQQYIFYTLPLPKDNPDENAPMLISNADDEHEELKLPKGEFYVEIADMNGLGLCKTEEELTILYSALTGEDIEE